MAMETILKDLFQLVALPYGGNHNSIVRERSLVLPSAIASGVFTSISTFRRQYS